MSRTSESAQLIASYRDATSMRSDQRERALRKLQARLSADPTPVFRPEVPVPELPPALPAAWVQLRARWQRIVTVSKVILGAALLTWLATDPDTHDPAPLIGAVVVPPGTNARAVAEPDRTSAPRGVAEDSDDRPNQREVARFDAKPAVSAQSSSAAPLAAPRAGASSKAARVAPAQGPASAPLPTGSAATGVRSGRAPDSDPAAPHRELMQNASIEPASTTPDPRHQFVPRTADGHGQVPERAAQPPTAASLEQETVLLEQAQGALQRGDAERALHLLAEHTWLFPAGHLAEARDVARILALCQAGHVEHARTRAKSFLAARPHSPFAARVRSSCPRAAKPHDAK